MKRTSQNAEQSNVIPPRFFNPEISGLGQLDSGIPEIPELIRGLKHAYLHYIPLTFNSRLDEEQLPFLTQRPTS